MPAYMLAVGYGCGLYVFRPVLFLACAAFVTCVQYVVSYICFMRRMYCCLYVLNVVCMCYMYCVRCLRRFASHGVCFAWLNFNKAGHEKRHEFSCRFWKNNKKGERAIQQR